MRGKETVGGPRATARRAGWISVERERPIAQTAQMGRELDGVGWGLGLPHRPGVIVEYGAWGKLARRNEWFGENEVRRWQAGGG